MKSLNHFLILFCGAVLILFSSLGFAKSPDDIYRNGKSAFDKGDYLSAVKHLFAYQRVVEGNIDQSLKDIVSSAIKYCDEQISLAIRTKEDLDKYGQITEVVIDASGSADGIYSEKKHKKYHKPTAKYIRKPSLPSSAPAAQSTKKSSLQIVKQIKFIAPKGNINKADEKKNIDQAEKKLDVLERRYELLKNKCDKEIEKNKVLMERYQLLKEKYIALLEQQR